MTEFQTGGVVEPGRPFVVDGCPGCGCPRSHAVADDRVRITLDEESSARLTDAFARLIRRYERVHGAWGLK